VVTGILEGKRSGPTVLGGLFITADSKDEVIRQLSVRAGELCNELTAEEIERLVHQREAIVSSVVSEDIAFPHAIKPAIPDNVVVISVLSAPLDWGVPGQKIRVVVLFAGGDHAHLTTMSTIARILRAESVLENLVSAGTEEELLNIVLDQADALKITGKYDVSTALNRQCVEAGLRLQLVTPKSALVLVGETFSDAARIQELFPTFRGYILCEKRHGVDTDTVTWVDRLRSSFRNPGMDQRELMRLLMDGVFGSSDVLVVLFGIKGSNRITSIQIVMRDAEGAERLLLHIDAAVSGRVLELAEELGREGREGKRVGALFVIGDVSAITPYTHQLIVNPFRGYPVEARNILDPSLDETIKELSKIDGAFVIDVDGTVASAGTYLAVSLKTLDHHPGEGARHASARAMTAVTDSITVTVSESSGRVSVYVKGQRHL